MNNTFVIGATVLAILCPPIIIAYIAFYVYVVFFTR